MNSKQYVETYNKAVEKIREAEEFYSDKNMQKALESYQEAAKLLVQSIKQSEQVGAIDMVVELQNLLVFVSVEVDSIEQDIEDQM